MFGWAMNGLLLKMTSCTVTTGGLELRTLNKGAIIKPINSEDSMG